MAVPGPGKSSIVLEDADQPRLGRSVEPVEPRGVGPDRLFARFVVICASSTIVLLAAGFVTGPESERLGLLGVIGILLVVVALAIRLLSRGFSRRVLMLAGVVLMVLGVTIGASISDSLDAVVILPLTGALLVIPVLRGRLLTTMFAAAFGASIAGEIAAHAVRGRAQPGSDSAFELISLTASAVMLAFAYGLVWWVSNAWRASGERTSRVLADQRYMLALNERLVLTLDPGKVLNLVADSLKLVLPYDNLTIYRVDREAGLLRPVLARDRFEALILENSFPLEHGITGWVVTHAEPQCVNDAQRDPRMSLIPGTPAEDESIIIVPLIGEGDVLGTLNVGRMGGSESHFSAADFQLARLFAGQAAIALLNADRHRAFANQAMTDALTGLYNRGAFEDEIAALLADPAAQPVTLLMLDLDGFKAFNDRHGHPAGDSWLSEVAVAIRAAVRAGDRVCRFGGDEFAVLLPAASPAVGTRVAERIRSGIAALHLGPGIGVTASVGAARDPGAATRDAIVAAADAALYRAKALGGNQVALAEAAEAPVS
jgi:diguanylate cyclase (GGDEF)-like protein